MPLPELLENILYGKSGAYKEAPLRVLPLNLGTLNVEWEWNQFWDKVLKSLALPKPLPALGLITF